MGLDLSGAVHLAVVFPQSLFSEIMNEAVQKVTRRWAAFCKMRFLETTVFHFSFSFVLIPICGRKKVMAVMKHKTFDAALRTNGIGEEGYEKPNNAQIENTKNIAARVNKVNFDIFVNGDNVNSEKLEISIRNRGRKKSRVSCVEMGGYSLHITTRSYGNSNIIGADIVPTMALPSATFSP